LERTGLSSFVSGIARIAESIISKNSSPLFNQQTYGVVIQVCFSTAHQSFPSVSLAATF
jgi:hypothetical protein